MVDTYFSAAILYNPTDQSVFLQLRDGNTFYNPHCWAGFGGSAEPEDGNDPATTALRELNEEVGYTFTAAELLPLRQNTGTTTGVQRYVYYVRCELPKSTFTLGEGEDFDWHPLKTVFDLKLTPETRLDLKELERIV